MWSCRDRGDETDEGADMPMYEYEARDGEAGCDRCRAGFDALQSGSEAPLERCPDCGAAVRRRISAPSIGLSRSGLDTRAKDAGFHKLKRLGKGEYETQY
jgi:putative FmdB family regulatory protein